MELDDKNIELTSLAESYRSELVERALTEAMRASPKAEQLIARAQQQKSRAGRLEMLRGQLASFRSARSCC